MIEKPTLFIIGIECRTANTPEAAPHDIPKHWGKFYSEQIFEKILHKASEDVIALYCDYEGDYTKPYSLVIGCLVHSTETIPEGMVMKKIPSGSYAIFKAVGEHPKALVETWGKIWQDVNLERTYSGDYEVYSRKLFGQSPPEVDVYIATEKSPVRNFSR